MDAYAKAGAVAEEVISSIRTVTAFSGHKKEIQRYSKNLITAKSFGIKRGVATGTLMGTFNIVLFGVMALAFWFGAKQVREEGLKVGDILTVFFAVVIGAFSIGFMVNN